MSFRFPRVEYARHDKSWKEAMSVDDLETIKKESAGKLFKRHLDEIEDDIKDSQGGSKKRQKRNLAPRQKRVLEIKNKAIDFKEVPAISQNLSGKVIVVEPSGNNLKATLERIIIKHCGTVEQNVKKGVTDYYIQTVGKFKAKSVIRSEAFDVINSDWLLDCEKKFRLFQPWDMIFTTHETLKEFEKRDTDQFMDPFSEYATEKSLKYAMAMCTDKHLMKEPDRLMMANLEFECFQPPYKLGLFRSLTVYIDQCKVAIDCKSKLKFHPMNLTEKLIKFYGGTTTSDFRDEITHVVVHEDNSRVEELKELRRSTPHGRKFRIVRSQYFDSCLKNGRLLPCDEFEM